MAITYPHVDPRVAATTAAVIYAAVAAALFAAIIYAASSGTSDLTAVPPIGII
jgi:hypothetical protein